jgi:uncharacterized protein (TIGR02444 family)
VSGGEFWTFSLAVYRDPAVQQECLALQDRHGIDVNLLLLCAFAGAVHGALLSAEDVKQAEDAVAHWQHDIVTSLRGVRRALKPLAEEKVQLGPQAAALRESVKAAELEAEHIEQQMLERWVTARLAAWPRGEPAAAVTANIRALFAATATPQPQGLPAHLIAAALAAAGRSAAP